MFGQRHAFIFFQSLFMATDLCSCVCVCICVLCSYTMYSWLMCNFCFLLAVLFYPPRTCVILLYYFHVIVFLVAIIFIHVWIWLCEYRLYDLPVKIFLYISVCICIWLYVCLYICLCGFRSFFCVFMHRKTHYELALMQCSSDYTSLCAVFMSMCYLTSGWVNTLVCNG